MQLRRSADTTLALLFIALSAMTIALARPITVDLTVYAVWLADLDSYQFDTGFTYIGKIIRLVSDDVRLLVFTASFLLQLAVLRCCVLFFPEVSRFLFVIAGSTTYWHVSLSSNVVRNGFAISIAALILTAGFGGRRLRFVLSLIASTLTHWATLSYFFILWAVEPGRRIKVVHLLFMVVLAASIFALGFFFFDLAAKLSVYGSSDVFTEDRSSQTPRMLAQVFLLGIALYGRIAPASMQRMMWLSLGILIVLSPFPEAFSRTSILIGLMLHMVYFGRILSEKYLSFPLKTVGVFTVAAIQILHPSTIKLLDLV